MSNHHILSVNITSGKNDGYALNFYHKAKRLPKVGEMMVEVVPDWCAYQVEKIIHHMKADIQESSDVENYECFLVFYGSDKWNYHNSICIAVRTEDLK